MLAPWQRKALATVCAFSSADPVGRGRGICTWCIFWQHPMMIHHCLSNFTHFLTTSNEDSLVIMKPFTHFNFASVSPSSFAICAAKRLIAPGFIENHIWSKHVENHIWFIENQNMLIRRAGQLLCRGSVSSISVFLTYKFSSSTASITYMFLLQFPFASKLWHCCVLGDFILQMISLKTKNWPIFLITLARLYSSRVNTIPEFWTIIPSKDECGNLVS